MTVWIQNPFDGLPCEGGRKQRYWLMAEAFLRAGHRVTYWTSDFSHATKQRRTLSGTVPDGMEMVLVPTMPYSANVSFRRIASHRAYARTWTRMAEDRREKVDLIVSSIPSISAAAAALALGRSIGAKVAIDVQDAWPETFERLAPQPLCPFASALLAPLRREARRIYRDADIVTGTCDRYRDLTGRNDYYRAYLGIEIPKAPVPTAAADDGSGMRRLVYSGNLGRTYDLATVVKAVEADTRLELDVAGFGEFSSKCPRVRFHGLLPNEQLRALYAKCDLGIIPMRDDSWVGIPNKMFDYAVAGLKIATSLGGETADLIARYRCGATYESGDAASLADAMSKCDETRRGASLEMCRSEFDAIKIYDDYVRAVSK